MVVLGKTGRNFAAGMSGGITYVYDKDGDFADKCNAEMVDLLPVTHQPDIDELMSLIEAHQATTNSPIATALLKNWKASLPKFVKILPRDYARMLEAIEEVLADKEASVKLSFAGPLTLATGLHLRAGESILADGSALRWLRSSKMR